MIQFKWVEKEEEKDFYRLRHCEWFFARWQKFCTQPQLCWCHATEDSYNELKFTNKNAEWERKYQYDYYAGIPYQRQSHGNWTKILFKRTLFTCWFCFFVLSLINTNAIEKPVSTVWSNLMKKKIRKCWFLHQWQKTLIKETLNVKCTWHYPLSKIMNINTRIWITNMHNSCLFWISS